MATASIPVDLLNPGQVFGCIGLLEAVDVLLGDARGWFDWSGPHETRFNVSAHGDEHPVESFLEFLANAKVSVQMPWGSHLTMKKAWGVDTSEQAQGDPFPFAEPDSPATLPALLTTASKVLAVNHWGDSTRRDKVKFWAGSGGYPGAAFLRDSIDLARDELHAAATDPFAVSAPQTSSFRFDWRRDYVPLQVGFSPNAHGHITPMGYPLVEVLAALGLAHARPSRPDRKDKLSYRYSALSGDLMPLPLLRAGLGCAQLPFPQRTFHMTLDWPGQEGQARCITDVIEET